MSNARHTPETDAAFKEFNDGSNTSFVRMTVHAQKLEQQRDALAASLRHLANNVTAYFDPGYDNRHYYRDEKKLVETAEKARDILAKAKGEQ